MIDPSSSFLNNLAAHLAKDAQFADYLAGLVARALVAQGGTFSASAAAAAPAKRGPGRPRKEAAAAPAPAKRGPGRPPGSSGEGSVNRVLAAIRAGATTKKEITGKARVSSPAYSYSVKTLREKGLIRVVGTRGTAKILAV